MFLDDLLAEKGDRADVLNGRSVDDRRHEPFTRVPKYEQRFFVEWNRPEESCFGVGERLDLTSRDLV